MRAVEGMLRILRDEGVDRVFGNPGTTELPFVDALSVRSDLRYVLGPHEGSLVATADGYARASRRPSFVSLHVAAGLANGLIGMLNALRSRTPMVITAGQQDSRHLIQEPMLAGDLVTLAAAASKWAAEVHRAEDLGVLLRRAFRAAVTPPAGPVFLSVPMDLLAEELGEPVPARTPPSAPGPAGGVATAVTVLRSARAPVLVAGDGVGRADAVEHLVRVAESLGAVVYHAPMHDRLNMPMDHPLHRGMLPPENASIRKALDAHDVVLLVGVHAFAPHHYSPGPALTATARVVQIDDDPGQLARTYPAEVALVGDIRATLEELATALGPADAAAHERGGAIGAETVRLRPALPESRRSAPIDPAVAAATVADHLPDGAILVEEAITVGLLLRTHLRLREPDTFHHTVGGGLGWGIGAAVGVSLARPDRPVVAALGDGCALFGVHGLWTAAAQRRPCTFVVFVNNEYRTLKQTLTRMRSSPGGFPGMDLAEPAVDWPALSTALGVPAVQAASADQLAAVLSTRSSADGPLLVEVPVEGFS